MLRGMHYMYIIASLMMLSGSTLAVFISTPASLNAILGSTAVFSCSATGGTIDWMINQMLLSELGSSDVLATSRGSMFFLQVPATEEYNNSVVVCEVVIRDPLSVETSDPAVLRVQGLLDAVSNLKSESLGQVIHLIWDAPPSLDITGVDPDIWYRVEISVNNISMRTHDTINIPEFSFTMDNDTSTSVVYEFRVTPINGAGAGITSNPVTGYFTGQPTSITPNMVDTSGSADPLNVIFSITYGNISPGEMPDRFKIYAETVEDEDKHYYCTDYIAWTRDSDGRVVIQLNTSTPTCESGRSSLEPHRRYKAVISAENEAGQSNSTGDIRFSTHEAQHCGAKSSAQSGTVNINCTFSENSRAKGYLSVLSSETNSSQEMFVVANRFNMSSSDLEVNVSGVPRDSYTVVVYDLENNGLPVLSNETNPFVLCAEEEHLDVTTDTQDTGADNVMNGVFLEVSNAEVPVCVSFECITDSGEMVVLAHHIGDDDGDGDDDTEKLSAYNLNATNNCVTSLAIGSYSVGVFMVKNDRTLVAPPTHLTSSSASTLTFCTPGLPASPGANSVLITVVALVSAIIFIGLLIGLFIGFMLRRKIYSKRNTYCAESKMGFSEAKQEEGNRSHWSGSQEDDPERLINSEPEDCQLSSSPPVAASSFVETIPILPVENPSFDRDEDQVTQKCTAEIIKGKGAMVPGNMTHRRVHRANQNAKEHLQLPQLPLASFTLKSVVS